MKPLLIALALAFTAMPAQSADIVALCIGNDNYQRSEDVLDTPVADATLMKRTLEALPGGADVELLTDASRTDIVIALNALKDRSKGAKLALVFYSGHGMDGQPRGYASEDTFLLPVEAVIPTADHLAASAVGLREVLAALKDCPVIARAVILDCCRTGAPQATGALLEGQTKSFGSLDERVKAALGKAIVPDATLVAFAASPGRKAAAFLSDRDANSPFTSFLAEQLRDGSGNLRDLVEMAATRTEEATERRQVPYVSYNGSASAIREIVWRSGSVAPSVPVVQPVLGNAAEMEKLRAQLAAAERAREEAERRAALVPSIPSITMAVTAPVTTPAFSASRGMEGSREGETREFGGIEMVWCPAGEFLMGSPVGEEGRDDDETQHRVTLTKGFWMAKTECTQGQWASVMGSNPSNFKGAELPVETVSWDDVQGWLQKMNSEKPPPSGWKWVLPTEAQWEYACRAGKKTVFSFGDVLNGKEANCDGNYPYGTSAKGAYLEKTASVGNYAANAWGLHDMHGNVWEWCRDWYDRNYYEDEQNDPTGPTSGVARVIRGGSWYDVAQGCRSAFRGRDSPDVRDFSLGFRPALVPSRE
jgi:formylglycine-generating enzyme required for sulfatase activity